jgi:hypothetical protein
MVEGLALTMDQKAIVIVIFSNILDEGSGTLREETKYHNNSNSDSTPGSDESDGLESFEMREPRIVRFGSKLPKTQNIIKVACGNNHTLALTNGGLVFSWGINNKG